MLVITWCEPSIARFTTFVFGSSVWDEPFASNTSFAAAVPYGTTMNPSQTLASICGPAYDSFTESSLLTYNCDYTGELGYFNCTQYAVDTCFCPNATRTSQFVCDVPFYSPPGCPDALSLCGAYTTGVCDEQCTFESGTLRCSAGDSCECQEHTGNPQTPSALSLLPCGYLDAPCSPSQWIGCGQLTQNCTLWTMDSPPASLGFVRLLSWRDQYGLHLLWCIRQRYIGCASVV